MKKELRKHKEEYIHIKKPKLKSVTNFFLGLILLTLSYFNLKLILYKWKDLGLDVLFNCEENCSQFANLIQLDICFNLIFEFGLILFGIILTFNLINKIDWKEFLKELSLILNIVLFLVLILGLIGGLIAVMIVALIGGLIAAMIVALVWGLNVGYKRRIK